MFEKLTYSVTFPSTGRSFDGDIDFQTGFGTITGPNEAGKSLIIEIARWCLFGSTALRGKADDYKTLKASLTFRVRGNQYEVKRTHNTATIAAHDTQAIHLCSGTKPVNAHIVQLLGFGLEVFDVACAANQGDVERLSTMKPTERKRMVDEVVGLNRLEDLAKWCGDEARALERAIVDPGSEPVAPSSPMGDLDAARAAYEELHKLKGVLSVAVAPPVEPTTTVSATMEYWKGLVDKEGELRAELRMLGTRLDAMPKPSPYSDLELENYEYDIGEYEHWQARQKFERLHPRSFQTRGALLVMRDDWAVVGQRESLGRLVKELKAHGEVDCPSCQHHFFLESGRLDDLERQLETLGNIKAPSLSLVDINTEMGKVHDWDLMTTIEEWGEVKDAEDVEKPSLTQREIDLYRRANAAAVERAEVEARILELRDLPDHSPQYQARVTYESDYRRYLEDKAWYERRMAERAQAQAQAATLGPLADLFPVLGQLQIEWNRYRDRKELWDGAKVEFDRLTIEADGYRRAQTALNNLRALVKGHLVPALSKVASHLLHQMTGGQRSVVSVDQDFDVMVDGQALDTLSGSGRAVANLALRLGLGQVLTNNVLSVFIGDEIDASMDDDRAGNLGKCIRTLSSKISQIILVTHKSHGDADWCVNLGKEEND